MKRLVKAALSVNNVTYKRDKEYSGHEAWHILVNGTIVGKIFRKSSSSTRVDAVINGKNVYGNGFHDMKTAKMYVRDFISDYINK